MDTKLLNTIAESLVFLCGAFLLFKLTFIGLKSDLHKNRGWGFIVAGYSLILFAIFIDIIEDYYLSTEDLQLLKVILEEIVGFLLGFIFISVGILLWIPKVIILRKAKKALKRSQSELRGKLKDYSKKLEEEKLKSQKANEQKESFLNNMSHELRTPLNGIIGCVEIILDTNTSPEQKKYLERANQSSDDLLNIINNILDIKDAEKENLQIYKEHFNIEDFTYDLLTTYEKKARAKDLSLNWSLDHRVPKRLFGSPTQLKVALSKIIENSITYTKKGNIDIQIFSNEIDNGKTDLIFKISDTGVGIPEELHNKIFAKFTKVPYKNLKPSPGLGLGLSIASTLISKMNGQIELEDSVEGKGSIFNINIPIHIVE